jgi:hypothetical protein
MQLVIQTAIEWWRNSGDRTKERLRDILAHYAHTYAVDTPERIEAMLAEAWGRIPEWQKEKKQ